MEITPNAGAETLVDTAPETTVEQKAPVAEEAKQEAPKPDDVQTKYEKMLAKEQRRINRLTAAKYEALSQNKMLQERLAKLEAGQSEKKDARPTAEQFQSYDEYQEALTDWKVDQKLKALKPEAAKPEQVSKVPPQEAAYAAQMEATVTHQATELAKHIPDFVEAMQENAPIFDAMPYELEKAFYQSQHPALAAYVLAKEGKLEDLLEMTPQQAAYEIGRATHVGVSNITQYAAKQTTKAPAPMASAKGTASASKTPDTMSGKELLKWINS